MELLVKAKKTIQCECMEVKHNQYLSINNT